MPNSYAQIPIKDLPGIAQITFHERTTNLYSHTYDIDDIQPNERLVGQLNDSNRDFEGWPDKEFYDVFYSDADGTFNANGAYATIEARFDMNTGGGGLNIAEVELHFENGTSFYCQYVSSSFGNGPNYIPGSEPLATDCDLFTGCTMGSTQGTNLRLRITIGVMYDPTMIIEESCSGSDYEVTVNNVVFNESNPVGLENIECDSLVLIDLTFHPVYDSLLAYDGCMGDGYNVIVNGATYDEMNPSGIEQMVTIQGCDSIVNVDLTFAPPAMGQFNYEGCQGDGYTVTINGIVYDESHQNGTETLIGLNGCDSIVAINLVFDPETTGIESYTGCTGDGYAVEVNGRIYNESNTQGIEVLTGSNGCDSTVTIDLQYLPETTGEETYFGCSGDGYAVIVNGIVYDEGNTTGLEILTGSNGCDSVVFVELSYFPVTEGVEYYSGCSGSGYSVNVSGTVYDENNPGGVEILLNSDGCDSIVTIDLEFADEVYGEELYVGCIGDGYSIVVNGTVYNENNPNGTETLISAGGCDSVVTISLFFAPVSMNIETYSGCEGDGYVVIINGTAYNESNPSGTETLISQNGCDSIVTILLQFAPPSMQSVQHFGCTGDGYEVAVNGTLYNESNPSGVELLTGSNGCDSIVSVSLSYENNAMINETYTGCAGDGYSITLNGNTYDENNPTGIETLQGVNGCDSIVTIDLTFLPQTTAVIEYEGCVNDGYSINVNGTIYDQTNPQGTEILAASNGCDSVVTILLNFEDGTTGAYNHTGCTGDGFSVNVNGTLYNESNPTGAEILIGSNGCDSVVTITLEFNDFLEGTEMYKGCTGDGYSVNVNGTIYNESNPIGSELLTAASGCDSIVTIELIFHPQVSSIIEYEGCTGDGFSLVVNSATYNEQNPAGTETLTSQIGCDSLVVIELNYSETFSSDYSYTGCEGDAFSISINGAEYNELNPSGVEVLQSAVGCDSTVTVQLEFEPCDTIECGNYVPNVFSANGDNINDTFRFYFSEQCRILTFQIQIFDRWGALLFESTDPAFTWDARFRDQELNPGVYVFVAEIFFEGEADPVLEYGDVTIIR